MDIGFGLKQLLLLYHVKLYALACLPCAYLTSPLLLLLCGFFFFNVFLVIFFCFYAFPLVFVGFCGLYSICASMVCFCCRKL
jgi:hypothetical protein